MKFAAVTIAALLFSASSQATERAPASDRSRSVEAPSMCPEIDRSNGVAERASRERLLMPDKAFVMNDLVQSVMSARKAAALSAKPSSPMDWPGFCRYAAANRLVRRGGIRPHVVLIGDSITDNWLQADPGLFDDKILDRGIAGQTSSQVLLRMYPDVVSLEPQAVQIMVGTNDIAENDGPIDDKFIIGNVNAMIDLALAHHIQVILGSIPPAFTMFWNPGVRPAERIVRLNGALRELARHRHLIWVDYYNVLTDRAGGLPTSVSNDGVHPTRAGYKLMRPLLERAMRLSKRHP